MGEVCFYGPTLLTTPPTPTAARLLPPVAMPTPTAASLQLKVGDLKLQLRDLKKNKQATEKYITKLIHKSCEHDRKQRAWAADKVSGLKTVIKSLRRQWSTAKKRLLRKAAKQPISAAEIVAIMG